MKKQKKQFIILAVLCMFCIGGYFLIRNAEFEEKDAAAATTVTDFNADEVTALKVSGDVSLDFFKEDGEWKESSLPDETINQESVTGLLSQICNITTTETVVEAPENLEQYGLKEPVCTVSVTFTADTALSLWVGGESSLLGKYYVQVSRDPNVYLVSSYIVTEFERTPEDFVEEEAETESMTETGSEE